LVEPTVGPWAREKLNILAKYLKAYTKILNTQRQRSWLKGYVYIDAFAGAGHARVRGTEEHSAADSLFPVDDKDQAEYLHGSPRVALEVSPPFTAYVFVEKQAARVQMLENLKQEYGDARDIRIYQGDCNEYFLEKERQIDWSRWRALVFLDPFGMHVPWSTIERLANTRGVEVFINFPMGMAIRRLLKRNGEFTPQERAKLDDYFGTPDWYSVVYRGEADLFGLRVCKTQETDLVEWYVHRLREAFGYASSARLIRNSKGGHLYYLIFAGPNKIGCKIANQLLKAGEVVS